MHNPYNGMYYKSFCQSEYDLDGYYNMYSDSMCTTLAGSICETCGYNWVCDNLITPSCGGIVAAAAARGSGSE